MTARVEADLRRDALRIVGECCAAVRAGDDATADSLVLEMYRLAARLDVLRATGLDMGSTREAC